MSDFWNCCFGLVGVFLLVLVVSACLGGGSDTSTNTTSTVEPVNHGAKGFVVPAPYSEDNYQFKENNNEVTFTAMDEFGNMLGIDKLDGGEFEGLKDCHQKFEDMKLNKIKHDMSNYAIQVHALKSDSKYFGFDKLAEMSYEHEMKSKANDEEYVNSNFESLEREFLRISMIIEKYLRTLYLRSFRYSRNR